MNKLNAGQKSILTKTLQNDKGIYMFEELPDAVQNELENINNFEDLTSAVNRFIWDYNTEREIASRLSSGKSLLRKGGR
jgi:hypothetical protein